MNSKKFIQGPVPKSGKSSYYIGGSVPKKGPKRANHKESQVVIKKR